MATVSITSILGSDSISASRTTINSNFLILQNWINQYSTTFNVDSVNGIIDISSASTGRISAKTGKFDQIIVPSGGTALAQINSAGAGQFVQLSTTTLTASGASTLAGPFTSNGSATFNGNTSLLGQTSIKNKLVLLPGSTSPGSFPAGNIVSQNSVFATGATSGTAFPASNLGGGGYLTTVSSPYVLNGYEDVIYAQCGPGFYLSVGTTGATASALTAGTRITVINTGTTGGFIATGIQNSGAYYTGFNTTTNYGQFPSTGITCDANRPYQSSIQLQWEPRIAKGTGTQQGSWVVLSSSNMSWS
jgi:hypothetical protein